MYIFDHSVLANDEVGYIRHPIEENPKEFPPYDGNTDLNSWIREEETRSIVTQEIKERLEAYNTEDTLISVYLNYTTYESYIPYCMDGSRTLCTYVTADKAVEATIDAFSELDLSNPNRIEEGTYAYGHSLQIRTHTKEDVDKHINELIAALYAEAGRILANMEDN